MVTQQTILDARPDKKDYLSSLRTIKVLQRELNKLIYYLQSSDTSTIMNNQPILYFPHPENNKIILKQEINNTEHLRIEASIECFLVYNKCSSLLKSIYVGEKAMKSFSQCINWIKGTEDSIELKKCEQQIRKNTKGNKV